MNYKVTGEQLTDIADEIRSKGVCKNLCNPDTLTANGIVTNTDYRCSADVKWDGVTVTPVTVKVYITGETDPVTFSKTESSAPAAGTTSRIDFDMTVLDFVSARSAYAVVSTATGVTVTNIQIEKGGSATTYEPYKLTFPTDFNSKLESIIPIERTVSGSFTKDYSFSSKSQSDRTFSARQIKSYQMYFQSGSVSGVTTSIYALSGINVSNLPSGINAYFNSTGVTYSSGAYRFNVTLYNNTNSSIEIPTTGSFTVTIKYPMKPNT